MSRAHVAIALVCVALVGASACGDSSSSSKRADTKTTSSTSTTSTTLAGTGTAPSPPGSGITGNVLPAVKVGQAAPLAQNLFATVTKIEPVTLEAHGVGETAGPGIVVTLQLRNATAAPVDLAGIAINAHYGAAIPAPPNDGPPAQPLTGSLAPGATATGRYSFRVPSGQVHTVKIDIQDSAAPDVAIVEAS